MNKKFKYLDLLFCLILIIECFSLFLSRPHFYEAARLLISIILFIYNYKGNKTDVFSLYVYVGLSLVFIADILTMFYYKDAFLYYTGLATFTLSYIAFAAIYYRCRQIVNRKKIPLNLLSLAALQFILIGLFYFVNGIADNVWIAQGILHTIVLIILMTWAFKSNKRVGINKFFLLAAILMLVANILFAIVLIQNNQYVIMRVFVVFFHGVSILILSKATNKYLEANLDHQLDFF